MLLPLPRSRRGAFTLIELLIVLAIVGILAAIVFPMFSNAREDARRRNCASNLKQIGLGVLMYGDDYDEKYPRPSYEHPRVVWQQVIQPYVKSTNILMCLSNPGVWRKPLVSEAVQPHLPSWDKTGPYPEIPRSYALNHRASYGDRAIQLEDIKSPSHKILVAESDAPWPDYGSAWWNGRGWEHGFAGHLHTANYLFVDGHVKAMKPLDTAKPFNMWGGMDGGVCRSRSINCDTPEPTICEGLEYLQDRS